MDKGIAIFFLPCLLAVAPSAVGAALAGNSVQQEAVAVPTPKPLHRHVVKLGEILPVRGELRSA